MAPSCTNCCNVELEIVEMKNFISRWFDVFSRRFDDQDRKLTVLVDAISAVNFDVNFPPPPPTVNSHYEDTKEGDNCEEINSNDDDDCIVKEEHEQEEDVDVERETEEDDDLNSLNISYGATCSIDVGSNIISDQFTDDTATDDHLTSMQIQPEESSGDYNADLVKNELDEGETVENMFDCFTCADGDIADSSAPFSMDSYQLDPQQPGTSTNNFLLYSLKKKRLPSAACPPADMYFNNNVGCFTSSTKCKSPSTVPKVTAAAEPSLSSVLQQQAAAELRRTYLARMNKFSNTRMNNATTAAQQNDNNHRSSSSVSGATNKTCTFNKGKIDAGGLKIKSKYSETCPICSKRFSSVYGMNRHKKVKHNERGVIKFKCKYCNKLYAWNSDLLKHINTAHKSNAYFSYEANQ